MKIIISNQGELVDYLANYCNFEGGTDCVGFIWEAHSELKMIKELKKDVAFAEALEKYDDEELRTNPALMKYLEEYYKECSKQRKYQIDSGYDEYDTRRFEDENKEWIKSNINDKFLDESGRMIGINLEICELPDKTTDYMIMCESEEYGGETIYYVVNGKIESV